MVSIFYVSWFSRGWKLSFTWLCIYGTICHIIFTDLIEIVPNLVWFRPPIHPTNSLKPDNILDQNDLLFETINDVFPDPKIPHIKQNLNHRKKNLKILKKHLMQHHLLPPTLPGDPPSIIWTTVVVSIIHLLFEFFRWILMNISFKSWRVVLIK